MLWSPKSKHALTWFPLATSLQLKYAWKLNHSQNNTGKKNEVLLRTSWGPHRKLDGNTLECYWEHLEEHIGNLMGTNWSAIENILRNTLETWWEQIGNLMGTHWKLDGNTLGTDRNQPKKKPKEKKTKLPWAFSFGCMKFVFPKELVTIFKLD